MSITVIKQGERVIVEFVQGATVKGNIMFLGPDRVTPWPDLDTCTARMELREIADDTDALATLTSEAGDIVLSASGLIVWEISAEDSAALTAENSYGDLFIYQPDGDAVHVCGYDFVMTKSYTKQESA